MLAMKRTKQILLYSEETGLLLFLSFRPDTAHQGKLGAKIWLESGS